MRGWWMLSIFEFNIHVTISSVYPVEDRDRFIIIIP